MPVMNAVQVAEPGADLALVQLRSPSRATRGADQGRGLRRLSRRRHPEARPVPGPRRTRACPATKSSARSPSAARSHRRGGPGHARRRGLERRLLHDLRCRAPQGDYATARPVDHRPLGRRRLRRVHGRAGLGAGAYPGRALVGRRRAAAVRGSDHVQRPEGQRCARRRHRGDPRHRRARPPGDPVRQPARLHDRRAVARPREGTARPQARGARLHRHGRHRRRQGAASARRREVILATAPDAKPSPGSSTASAMAASSSSSPPPASRCRSSRASSSEATARSRAGTAASRRGARLQRALRCHADDRDVPAGRAAEAFEKMMSAKVHFRSVLTMGALSAPRRSTRPRWTKREEASMSDILELIRERARCACPSTRAPHSRGSTSPTSSRRRAGRPRAHNMQNFEIVVVDDPESRRDREHRARHLRDVHPRELRAALVLRGGAARARRPGCSATMFPPAWRDPGLPGSTTSPTRQTRLDAAAHAREPRPARRGLRPAAGGRRPPRATSWAS